MRESALNDCCARRRERCTLIQEVLAHRHTGQSPDERVS